MNYNSIQPNHLLDSKGKEKCFIGKHEKYIIVLGEEETIQI